MKNSIKYITLTGLITLLGISASASILFFDDFDGTGDLNGTTPDTTTGGTTWVGNTSLLYCGR